jgi:hypothetical protein
MFEVSFSFNYEKKEKTIIPNRFYAPMVSLIIEELAFQSFHNLSKKFFFLVFIINKNVKSIFFRLRYEKCN